MNKPTTQEMVALREKLANKFGEDLAQSAMVALLAVKTTDGKPRGTKSWETWAWLKCRNLQEREREKSTRFVLVDSVDIDRHGFTLDNLEDRLDAVRELKRNMPLALDGLSVKTLSNDMRWIHKHKRR